MTEPLGPLMAPLPRPPPLSDPKLETLASMFPEIEQDVLASLLSFHEGDVEKAASALLDMSTPGGGSSGVEETDAELARRYAAEADEELARQTQLELDDEVAKALHQELQQELQQERQSQSKKSELGPRAKAAAEALRKRFSTLSTRPKKERSMRLLESDGASDNFTNLEAPLSSPLQPLYSPPTLSVAPPATHAPPEPLAAASPDKYETRVSRAREANRQSSRSRAVSLVRTSSADPVSPVPAFIADADTPETSHESDRAPMKEPSHEPAQETAQVHVPVGELI